MWFGFYYGLKILKTLRFRCCHATTYNRCKAWETSRNISCDVSLRRSLFDSGYNRRKNNKTTCTHYV